MDIQFTEEQELLRSSVQRLLRDRYDFDARRKIVASEDGFSRKHWAEFAELGLLGAPFSEADGGLGGGPLSTMIIMQEFGRHLVVEPFVELLDYVIFAALLFYALTVGGLFILRRTLGLKPSVHIALLDIRGYLALYVLIASAIMLNLLFVKPTYTWPGLLIVLSGAPVYFFWRRQA